MAQPDYRIEKYDARKGLSHHWVSGVARDSTGFVWVSLLEGALARFDGTTFRHFSMNDAERRQFGSNQILRFAIENGKNFYVNIDHKYARFDPITGRFLPIDGPLSPEIVKELNFKIHISDAWQLFDNRRLQRKRDGAVFDLPEKISVDDVLDTGTEIWVAAFEGLFKITPRRRLFETPFSQTFKLEQGAVTGLSVYGICESGNWLWFHGNGALLRAPLAAPTTPETVYVAETIGGKGQLVPSRDNWVWTGRHSRGLFRFRPTEKREAQGFGAPDGFKSQEIFSCLELPNGPTWIATGDGILSIQPEKVPARPLDLVNYTDANQNIHEYATPPSRWIAKDSIHSTWQLHLENGYGPSVWAATDNGLFRLSPQNGDWVITGHFYPGKTPGFNAAKLLSINASGDVLWLGSDRGLIRFSSKSRVARTFTTADGLPNNKVYYALPDGDYLWCGTDFGLARVRIASVLGDEGLPDIRTFHVEDGLPHEEFNTLSFFKSPTTGKIYLGGLNGMTIFSPRDLETAAPPSPPLVFTEFEKYDGERDSTFVFSLPSLGQQTVTLGPHDRFFTVRFALLAYQNPGQNRYQFRLDGFEKKWNAVSLDNHARYANLPPGAYVFHVRAADHNGNWNPGELTLKLIVQQVWYKSWWAWLLYFVMAATGVYAIYRDRLRRAQMAANLQVEHARAQHLEELDSFKSRLFANISHEFRTPLTVILGNLDFLEKEIAQNIGLASTSDAPDKVVFNTKIASIRRNGNGLLRLVNQILDLAKLEDKTLKIRYIQGNVAAYVRYVAESLYSLANAQNVQIRIETSASEIWMDYDPERLGQVLQNLLSNALKFTPSGGRIEVRCTVEASRGAGQGHLNLTVADTGGGIPVEDFPYIFDRFFQADNQSPTKGGGTGIGLSLTKELVHLMGGDIGAESTLGTGTIFTVRLPMTNNAPLEKPDPEPSGAPSTIPLGAPRLGGQGNQGRGEAVLPSGIDPAALPRLLIVEDNPDVVAYLCACLDQHYRLEYAFNGRAGIEIAFETTPDIVLSDVMMPEKDGFELTDMLKNDPRTSHIPIVLLTAKADVESRIAGLRRGADSYLAKPFYPEELLVTLEKLLDNRQRMRARYSQLALEGAPIDQHREAAGHPSDTDAAAIQTSALEDEFLKKIREAIEKRMGESNLAAEDIARVVGMSRSVLYAKLSALTGLSFNIYLRSLRLREAKHLLKASDLNVSEIAYKVGFNDPRYFIRVFSEEFGLPPGEWRQRKA